MSTQTYDIVVMLGVIILIAVVIFWAARYGAAVISDIMLESPAVLQSAFASYATAACAADTDVFIKHTVTNRYPFYAFMDGTHVQISPAEEKYIPYTGTERGGYLGFGTQAALPFVGCGVEVVKKNVLFNQNLHHAVTLNRTADSMWIGVK